MRRLRFFLAEGWVNLTRSWRSSLLAASTIVGAVFVLASFLVVSSNLGVAVERWSSMAELSVYLADSATARDRSAIGQRLDRSPLVRDHEFLFPQQALDRFARDFPDAALIAGGLDRNPLPASFEVRLDPAAGDDAAVSALVTELRRLPGVGDVRYDKGLVDKLVMASVVARALGLVLSAVLICAATLTVVSVVRLGYLARRDEVEILYLVGTPIGAIKGPFAAEGALQGLAGALGALALLWLAHAVGLERFGQPLATVLGLESFRFLSPRTCLTIAGGALLVGGWAGYWAARNREDSIVAVG